MKTLSITVPDHLAERIHDYVQSGSYDEAVSVVQEAVKKDSSNIEALVRLRDIYIKMGKKRVIKNNCLSVPYGSNFLF